MRLDEIKQWVEQWSKDTNSTESAYWEPGHVETFLKASRSGDVPLYIAAGCFFVYAIALPRRSLRTNFVDDILRWNFSVPHGQGWSCTWSAHRGTRGEPSNPLERCGSAMLQRATPLIFRRGMERGVHTYIEPHQSLTHTLDVHQSEYHGDWIRLSNLGELQPIIRTARADPGWIVTIDRTALDEYLALSSSVLVRVIDVKKWRGAFTSWAGEETSELRNADDQVFAQVGQFSGRDRLVVRGFDLIRLDPKTKKRTLQRLMGHEPREYATFVIHDWRNGRNVEWPADPEELGNYFVESDLPYELSPAFFKPDVILQFKTDLDRYTVYSDRIECHGGWSVRYHQNEAGEIHAYIVDLARLPYEAQLQWKVYNLKEPGQLSARAIGSDFRGDWTTEYDPLLSLKAIAAGFPATDTRGDSSALWAPGDNLDHLTYVLSDSKKEFSDQVLLLTKVIVEGLHNRTINALAKRLGCRDIQLASIKQLDRVLEKVGADPDDRRGIIDPLTKLQALRSAGGIAHKGTAKIGDGKAEYRQLLEETDKALRLLARYAAEGAFSLE
ncbi:MAG: hypothetical protein ABI895_32425 [Deltaproteobacteria bacterium]